MENLKIQLANLLNVIVTQIEIEILNSRTRILYFTVNGEQMTAKVTKGYKISRNTINKCK